MTGPMDRRTFLAGVTAAISLGACSGDGTDLEPDTPAEPALTSSPPSLSPTVSAPPAAVQAIEAPAVDLASDPFGNGVASGDPAPGSVVLWTRLTAEGLDDEVPLVWEVSTTEGFETLVATELSRVRAAEAHTIRAVVDGLASASTFWYRFRAGRFTSPVGRTRTLPGFGDPAERLRLAVSSCQRRESGNYAAHRDIARADVDLVVWLGDFIYDDTSSDAIDGRRPGGASVATLAGYRQRYLEYRRDPLLQAAQAAHPWVSTWDDHEVVNDYDASVDQDQRAAAYRAWWEHTPTRLPPPDGDGLRVYRSIDVGDLARVCLVDVRQYAEDSTLLGERQQRWLTGQLENDQAWTVLASPVLFGSLVGQPGGATLLPYAWDGYPDARREVARLLAEQDSVIVSGDLHTSMVLDIKFDPDGGEEVTAATELMAPAISSKFPAALEPLAPLLPDLNSQVRHIDVANGWLLLDIRPEATTAEFRFVDDLDDPSSTMTVGKRYRVAAGDPYAEEL